MNRKQNQRNVRKLVRLGETSLGLTLPIEVLDKLKWREGHKIKVEPKGKSLVIRDWKK